MTMTKVKKLLKIGDSYAVILPKEFVDQVNDKKVWMEISRHEIHMIPHSPGKIFKKDMGFLGEFGSGLGDLSVNRKQYLKEALHAKSRRR